MVGWTRKVSGNRFVVGPYEEKNYVARVTHEANTIYRQHPTPAGPYEGTFNCLFHFPSLQIVLCLLGNPRPRIQSKNPILNLILRMLRVYRKLVYSVKCLGRHHSCPHPFSCLYYVLGVSFFAHPASWSYRVVFRALERCLE